MRSLGALCVSLTLALCLACDERSQPSVTSPTPSPSGEGPSGPRTLSVTVVEMTPQGALPIPGAMISFARGDGGGLSRADEHGRYVMSDLPPSSHVQLGASLGLVFQQLCAVSATMTADAERDIELVRPGAAGSAQGSPTLSGIVFEATEQGRQPAAGLSVNYRSNCSGMRVVHGFTGSDGRYEFCRVPQGPGCVTVITRELIDWDIGFVEKEARVEIRGNTVLDIDISR